MLTLLILAQAASFHVSHSMNLPHLQSLIHVREVLLVGHASAEVGKDKFARDLYL